MRVLAYFSTFAGALFPLLLFSVPCSALIAVPLTIPLPLEVRSPYLNFWTRASGSSGNTTTNNEFFFAEAFSGRTALLRIDGVTHSIFGQLALANQSHVTGSFITPTRTIFTLDIGPVEISVTFLSPIEPYDRVRQSIPFTYISFDLNVTDGKTHDIQLYAHVQPGAFVTSSTQNMSWAAVSAIRSVFEMAELQNQQPFSENAQGQAEWGRFYFATARSDTVTFGISSIDSLISTFTNHGSLNTIPATGSMVEGFNNTTIAMAFSRNLSVVANNATAVFAFGFIQDPAVQFVDPNGQPQRRVPYFKTMYMSDPDLIDDFIGDHRATSSRNLVLETKLFNDAAKYPHDYYSTLLSLATRLVFASTVLTVGETSDSLPNSTDVMMFMKNIGAGSATNRVNPVEVLYAAFPMFLYFDAGLGGLLLEPLLRYQASTNVTPSYAARDAGTSYPNTSIPSETHDQGIEQTANMLLMIYAHARTSGDVTLIQNHTSSMIAWTKYLIGATLYTTQQESADLLSIYNQTNLAIKGIIAIKAMSIMSDDAKQSMYYSTVADKYYAQWKSQALAQDNHLLIQYGNESSWSLGENMFADMWLQTGLISQDIFTAHVNFLKTVSTAAPQAFNISKIGMPLDSLRINNVTYSSNMFAAGFADTELQTIILSGMESHPLAEDLAVVNKTISVWSTSPNLGSAYAPLVLNVPLRNITHNASARHGSSTERRLGIAFGSIIAFAFLTGLLTFLYSVFHHGARARVRARTLKHQLSLRELYLNRVSRRWRRNNNSNNNDDSFGAVEEEVGSDTVVTDPFALVMLPPLKVPKSASSSESMRPRRDVGWRNLEDYEYDG